MPSHYAHGEKKGKKQSGTFSKSITDARKKRGEIKDASNILKNQPGYNPGTGKIIKGGSVNMPVGGKYYSGKKAAAGAAVVATAVAAKASGKWEDVKAYSKKLKAKVSNKIKNPSNPPINMGPHIPGATHITPKVGSGTANMKPGSRQTDTPGNFRADSAPQRFADNDAKVNTITKRKGASNEFGGGKGSGTMKSVIKGVYGPQAVGGAIGMAIAGGRGPIAGAASLVGASAKTVGNLVKQKVAKKRVAKYGQKGSAIKPHTSEYKNQQLERAIVGEKTFTGTASSIKGMRKDARHHRKNVDKQVRVNKRNEAISIKNKRKAESAAISATKVKKTYKTTAQKVGGAIKGVFAGNPQKRHEKKKKRALIKSIRKGY